MVFAFSVLILGFAIAIRMFERLFRGHFLSRSELTKIGTAYPALVIALAFVFAITFPGSHLALWIAVCVPLLFAAGATFAVVSARAKKFRERFRETLTVVSLKMKSGRSFRQALAEASAETDPHFRAKLNEVANAVVFSQQPAALFDDPFVAEAIGELTRIDQNPHASLKRLSIYRQKLRIEDDFRRRSGQVLARIRAQSIVMSGLYLAVFCFMVWKFGWRTNAVVLMTSALLFCIGGVWIYFGGRRLKWKV